MESTKEKLLRTASALFAKYGLDGVSTRDLVKASGVSLCSVNYHFGSKEKLYEAVLDSAIDKILSFAAEKQFPLKDAELSAADELNAIIGNMLEFLCSDELSGVQAELLIKEIIQPTAVYAKLYAKVVEPMHKRATALVMRITGLPEPAAILQTHCLMGQVVMFRVHKAALLRRMNRDEYDKALISEIKARILENCALVLGLERR